MEEEVVPLGRVVRPWGREGAVVVEIDADDAGSIEGRKLLLGRTRDPVRVDHCRPLAGGRLVMKIAGVDSIEAAEKLRGGELFGLRSEVPDPPEGSYHAFELVGLAVRTVGGEDLGHVTAVRATGGTDLLVVRGGGRERLIPFAREICTRIDPDEGLIEIDPPEGLLEL